MSSKIRPSHLSRLAIVYIRQSTLMQVFENCESTQRQYDLAQVAQKLGWETPQIQVLDEDLGKSGQSAENRSGFQHLVAQVSLGKVGAILSLEVSRFARCSADWHRLLDLCSLSDTLILDDDGVYDPNDFNDRLVLGLKGTMSDAERHMMRLRLQGGKLHKAQKGELAFSPPTGYVFDGNSLCFDPDEQVRTAVQLLFARFALAGSAYGVVHYFADKGLLFPSRHAHKGAPAEIRWLRLTHSRVLTVLKNPLYTGAYAWGRRRQRRTLTDGGVRKRCQTLSAREQWHILRFDSHPGYITWQEHLMNLQRLQDNDVKQHGEHGHGAPRKGEALLQGLCLCGVCGRRMRTLHRDENHTVYQCGQWMEGGNKCWTATSWRIDEKVKELFLAAVAPAELELSLAVVQEVERQTAEVERQWKLRLERAKYEATRAERQYHAVEPENRIVVRTLETRWNQKLQELVAIECEYEETRRAHKLDLSDADKHSILTLSKDLSQVFDAPTTTAAERKQLLRLLVEDVVLTPMSTPQRATQIRILWKTGTITEVCVPRPANGQHGKTPEVVVETIRELYQKALSHAQIAQELNRQNLKTGRGRAFTARAVSPIGRRNGLVRIQKNRAPSGRQRTPERDEQGRFSVRGLAAHYQVPCHRVRYWIARDVLTPQRNEPGGVFWFDLTPEVEARIALALRDGYSPAPDFR